MIVQKAAIYCRVDNTKEYGSHLEILDKMYYRLAAFAHAHKMAIVSCYEDAEGNLGVLTPTGIVNLLADYKKGLFNTILVTNFCQIPQTILDSVSESIYSLNTSERIRKILH